MKARCLLALAVTGLAAVPITAWAGQVSSDASSGAPMIEPPAAASTASPTLSLDPTRIQPAGDASAAPGTSTPAANPNQDYKPVLSLSAGGSASRIHGFGSFSINSQYITPRGLVAEKKSPQFQGLVGLVFDLYSGDGFINDFSVNAGTWGDYNTRPDKTIVTGADIWTEQDVFAGFDVKFAKQWDMAYTIQAWTFPDLTTGKNEIDPTTEYNMDWKFSFDDTSILHDFAMHPYVDVFWNFAGASSPVASNVLLGKNDKTFYVEMGIGPSYTLKVSDDFPVTFTFPMYFSVGDSSFWGQTPGPDGQRSNLGIFTAGTKISVPLKFIPQDFGSWNAFIGVTYFHTCNPALSYINDGAGDTHERFLGYAGVGFGF